MSDSYFVFSASEDGDKDLVEVSKDELLRRITPDKYGDTYYGKKKIHSTIPERYDSITGIVIIKGQIIVPKPKQVVTEFEIL